MQTTWRTFIFLLLSAGLATADSKFHIGSDLAGATNLDNDRGGLTAGARGLWRANENFGVQARFGFGLVGGPDTRDYALVTEFDGRIHLYLSSLTGVYLIGGLQRTVADYDHDGHLSVPLFGERYEVSYNALAGIGLVAPIGTAFQHPMSFVAEVVPRYALTESERPRPCDNCVIPHVGEQMSTSNERFDVVFTVGLQFEL